MFAWCYNALYLFAGKVLLMLGKVQFELQKLVDRYVGVDCYAINFKHTVILGYCLLLQLSNCIFFVLQRSHIFQTITNPSESLLNELRTVEVCLYGPFIFLKISYFYKFSPKSQLDAVVIVTHVLFFKLVFIWCFLLSLELLIF